MEKGVINWIVFLFVITFSSLLLLIWAGVFEKGGEE